jgi:MTH538 TIR-like domain (DUF1863)
MTRRIFISYQSEDRMRAKGFRLMRFNPNVEVDFFDRHLLDPVASHEPDYIRRCINERMHGTSVTVVLIGTKTHESEWVDYEIRRTLEEGKGLLGIRLKDKAESIPPGRLVESGAEVIDWEPAEFNGAIDRAARAPLVAGPGNQSGRASAGTFASGGGGGGSGGCGPRPTP